MNRVNMAADTSPRERKSAGSSAAVGHYRYQIETLERFQKMGTLTTSGQWRLENARKMLAALLETFDAEGPG